MTKLHNVIGGLEEKEEKMMTSSGKYIGLLENKGHNQLCNREVEVSDKEIASVLATADGVFGLENICNFPKLAKTVAIAIEQGKVLKVIE